MGWFRRLYFGEVFVFDKVVFDFYEGFIFCETCMFRV